MSDDDLLRELARAAREEEEEERRDPRWDALAAGTLPAEEEEALRREADSSMAAAERYEAFRPLDERFRERMVASIRAGQGGAARPVGAEPEEAALGRAQRAAQEPADLAAARRRRALRARWAAVVGLAAAAALLVVVWPRGGGPLPAYEARLTGGVESLRGPGGPPAAPAAPVFVPGNAFELVLTPDEPVAGRLAVRAYAADAAGALRPLDLPVEVSEQGAVRIAGRMGEEVVLPAGEPVVVVVVGRPGRLPPPASLAARRREAAVGEAIRGEDWRAWSLPLVVRETP